ncbi:MAG: hypothetical protein IJA94_04560 [Bacilli bacterium]|nr:hypothetical protein [Bacilli bacterium]
MKKRKKQIITYVLMIAALVAFIIIGKHNFKQAETDNDISYKHNILDKHNIYEKINASQALKKINSGNALIFMGFAESKQSEYYASLLNEVAKHLKIEKIYYYDFYNDRKENNGTYQTIVEKLTNYLQKDDVGKVDIQAPTFLVIKDGSVIYFDSDTSRIQANLSEEDYWNDYNKNLKKAYIEAGLKNYLGE